MAYPYYPATYQPYQPQMMQSYQPHQSGLQWVQGIEGAKSYPVGAGQSVLLMDSESNAFFIKSADASGMPMPLRVFDYVERTVKQAEMPSAAAVDTAAFVTREEFESRIAQICAEYGAKKKPVKKEGATDGE